MSIVVFARRCHYVFQSWLK